MKQKFDQSEEFKAIFEKYDPKTRQLYQEILRVFSNESPHTSKIAMRRKIVDMVKEALK